MTRRFPVTPGADGGLQIGAAGLDPLVERPEIVGADLAEVADAILTPEGVGERRP